MIQSVVGTGNFVSPMGLFVDGTGNIYIADTGDNRILEVDAVTGTVQTIAGSPSGTAGFAGDGGPATSALFNFPNAIVVDGSGNVFISDTTNNRIREVFAGSGIIQTAAGSGVEGFAGDGGPATSAELNYPTGLTIGLLGNLIMADSNNARVRSVAGIATPLVRAVTLSTAAIVFPAQIVSTTSAARSITITDFGKLSAAITSTPTIAGADASDFAIQNGTTTCTNGATLTQNNSCTITITFTPSGPGSRTASLSIFDNAFGSPQTVSLSGTAVDFSLIAATGGTTSAMVMAGQTATYNLQIMASGFSGTVSLSCFGAPAAATCSVVPTSISLRGNAVAPFTVTVTTTARSLGVPEGSLFGEPRLPRSLLLAFLFVALLGSLSTFQTKVRLRFVLPALLVPLRGVIFRGLRWGPETKQYRDTYRNVTYDRERKFRFHFSHVATFADSQLKVRALAHDWVPRSF
jgi:hypothetical protein